MRIGLIGGGVMGETIVRGLLAAEVAAPHEIVVAEPVAPRRRVLEKDYGISTTDRNTVAVDGTDVVVIAVKPQQIEAALPPLQGRLNSRQLVLSIAAGVRMATLRSLLSHDEIVRVMPNTPAQVRMGMSVWTATLPVTHDQRETARAILRALGKELYVEDEHYVDMATAVSGSGPAYVLLFLESLIDAGVHIGLPREQASLLALQTLAGTARLVEETGRHPAELRNMVTSPGGTTVEGLLALEEGGMRASLIDAVIRTYEKALELG